MLLIFLVHHLYLFFFLFCARKGLTFRLNSATRQKCQKKGYPCGTTGVFACSLALDYARCAIAVSTARIEQLNAWEFVDYSVSFDDIYIRVYL